jgi:hypothetical protein
MPSVGAVVAAWHRHDGAGGSSRSHTHHRRGHQRGGLGDGHEPGGGHRPRRDLVAEWSGRRAPEPPRGPLDPCQRGQRERLGGRPDPVLRRRGRRGVCRGGRPRHTLAATLEPATDARRVDSRASGRSRGSGGGRGPQSRPGQQPARQAGGGLQEDREGSPWWRPSNSERSSTKSRRCYARVD